MLGEDPLRKLGLSFFLFGLINNVLYVLILSAALDLVPPSTPKGIIAFCNIAPSLVAKVAWPYLISKGKIRYTRRLWGCAVLSTTGMLVVAAFDGLNMRLLGIALASFSSGLGELTFLQLSTTYAPSSIAAHCIGYFASGTGAAGIAGAFLWWEIRGLGVRVGVGVSSLMPSIIPLTYHFLLPSPSSFLTSALSRSIVTPSAYVPLATAENDVDSVREEDREDDENREFRRRGSGFESQEVEEDQDLMVDDENGKISPASKKVSVTLSANDKWRLVKPLLGRYMLPLCLDPDLLNFFGGNTQFEYTINQGISPTLLYPVPTRDESWILSKIIHSVRDYYPLWQLVYQSTVFLSRSSISAGLPALPRRWIKVPAFVQAAILAVLGLEAGVGLFGWWGDSDSGMGDGGVATWKEVAGKAKGAGAGLKVWTEGARNVWCVFALVCLEGICGGLAYVNVFHNLTHEPPPLRWESDSSPPSLNRNPIPDTDTDIDI
ncbi:hypothetical protein M413DRAFT_445489 [Hebeloma cylindrosporum]|uniref:Protein BTN n=1 Tax=Hebeloma cylindrosporum TaxID=76867 RepID=A0A0C2XV10_HEBCY|nr:hypothetical protein M413DRAFT_445489 [Hebeloma cylindrosporum h7]